MLCTPPDCIAIECTFLMQEYVIALSLNNLKKFTAHNLDIVYSTLANQHSRTCSTIIHGISSSIGGICLTEI